MPLNARQELFVQEYLKDLNATQAAIRAGYSERTARQTGAWLMAHPVISTRVREAKEQRIERVKIEQDDVLRELNILLKSSVDHFTVSEGGRIVETANAPENAIRAVSSVKHKVRRWKGKSGETEEEETEFRLWPKDKAVEMSMRHLGLMVDRLKIEDADEILAKVLGRSKEELPE